MKKTFTILAGPCFIAAFIFASHPAYADVPAPSAQLGKKLFTGTSLGANGKSCSTCHQSERKLGVLASKGSWFGGRATTLEQAINLCIESTLNGKPLPEDSVEIQSIALYMRSFIKR